MAVSVMPSGGGKLKRVFIGAGNSQNQNTYDIASLLPTKYAGLSADNFAVYLINVHLYHGYGSAKDTDRTLNVSLSYDVSTGALTITGGGLTTAGDPASRADANYNVYCFTT